MPPHPHTHRAWMWLCADPAKHNVDRGVHNACGPYIGRDTHVMGQRVVSPGLEIHLIHSSKPCRLRQGLTHFGFVAHCGTGPGLCLPTGGGGGQMTRAGTALGLPP